MQKYNSLRQIFCWGSSAPPERTHCGRGVAACDSTCGETTRTHPQTSAAGHRPHPPPQSLQSEDREKKDTRKAKKAHHCFLNTEKAAKNPAVLGLGVSLCYCYVYKLWEYYIQTVGLFFFKHMGSEKPNLPHIFSICFILMPHYLFMPITWQLGFNVTKQCQEY